MTNAMDAGYRSPRQNASRSGSGSRGLGSGLSGSAAIVLITGVTLIAGIISVAVSNGWGWAFNLAFALTTLYLGWRIRLEQRWTAVVAPPLAYALTLLITNFGVDLRSSGLRGAAADLATNLSFGAPWLVGATVAAGLIVLLRSRRAQR